MMVSRWILLRMRNIFKKSVANIRTYIAYIAYSIVFSPQNRAVYEIMWENIVQPDSMIWRMLFACWITKAKDKYSEYVIIIAFPRHQWLGKCLSCYYIDTAGGKAKL